MKVHIITGHEGPNRGQMYNSTLSLTSALDGGSVVNATLRPFYPGKRNPIPILQEAGWFLGSVSTNEKNLALTGIRAPDPSARSKSLYRLSYNVAKKWLEKYRIEMFSVSKINIKFYLSQSDIFFTCVPCCILRLP
jgi:hypothetical protein